MSITEVVALVSVLIAVGSLVLSVVNARNKAKVDDFQMLRETVGALDTECKRLRLGLQSAEAKIAQLEEENATLRAELRAAEDRIEDLEDENRTLRRELAASDPPDGHR